MIKYEHTFIKFQKLAIEKLMNAMQGISKEIIFKSPTGSGKQLS